MVNIPSTYPLGTIPFNQIDCLLFDCLAIWSKITYSGSKVLNHTATTEKIDSNICWGWGWLRQYFLNVSIRMHQSCGCHSKDQSSINQSINQSIKQASKQAINQSINDHHVQICKQTLKKKTSTNTVFVAHVWGHLLENLHLVAAASHRLVAGFHWTMLPLNRCNWPQPQRWATKWNSSSFIERSCLEGLTVGFPYFWSLTFNLPNGPRFSLKFYKTIPSWPRKTPNKSQSHVKRYLRPLLAQLLHGSQTLREVHVRMMDELPCCEMNWFP